MDAIDPADTLTCLRSGHAAGPIMPPIVQASLFRFETLEELFAAQDREHETSVYSRGTNPTVRELETALAALERAEAAKCFASGMGAISATLFALLGQGDHVLFCGDIYGPTIGFAQRLEGYGVSHSRCFAADIDGIEAALTPATRLIYLESPGSMRFELLPIEQVCALAKARGILTAIDNTVATPLLQKPLALGCDLALHSLTKYIGGHSDTLGGAVAGSRELVERIFYRAYMPMGAAMAPFDAWLLLRGLMTLPARLAQQQADALAVARWLADHPKVRRVFHPALAEGAQADLFARQMRGHSGLFSTEFDLPDHAATLAIGNRLKLFGKAISWGGVESLVTSPHRRDPGSEQEGRMPRTLLRLSVGLEGADALIADLEQALA
ncbi:PLP-dependent aspartate aminotransferase family protein [Pelagerythrobacter sp.]|uniref:trans-sulfuration enzyme family protein n=1 Tax=Pelagerythrobacter sp. TaxID=2800702 RepID=UPI0035B2DD25